MFNLTYDNMKIVNGTRYYLNVDSLKDLKSSTKVIGIKKTYFKYDFATIPTKKVMNKSFPKKEKIELPETHGVTELEKNIYKTGKYNITSDIYEVDMFPDFVALSVGTNLGIVISAFDLPY
ncbi:hypothetical protein [Kurthia massiliensis]|uniref:hypothetical protein n=1 Tax=Kurthia massiliensis TaxID=1033739 RepID=UPI000288E70B|nr:hypothetical protein [Kurthia massiliensis]